MSEIDLLNSILNELVSINTFFQVFMYGVILLIIIYFGYWFFSRFFY